MKDNLSSQLNQARVRQSFCRGLQSYHEAAQVQAQIARDLVQLLKAQAQQQPLGRVLEFGCGTGHLTQALLQEVEVEELTLNDLVPEAEGPMRKVLERQGQNADFRFGAIETLDLPGKLDLIASASTVQWIEDLPQCIHHLSGHLAPGGWLALSGFGSDQFMELAALGSRAAAPSYLDACDWPALLPKGMELVALRQQAISLHFDGVMPLLRHLRETGVNGHAARGWGRRDLRRFEGRYRELFEQDGKLPLTYDAVWVLARKTSSL